MDESWIISKLLRTFDDSKKSEFKEYFGEPLFNKLLEQESSKFDDEEYETLVNIFHDMIVDWVDYFDDKLEDPSVYEEEGGVYYQWRVGLTNEKLDMYFIYYYEIREFAEFKSFNELEKEFWNK